MLAFIKKTLQQMTKAKEERVASARAPEAPSICSGALISFDIISFVLYDSVSGRQRFASALHQLPAPPIAVGDDVLSKIEHHPGCLNGNVSCTQRDPDKPPRSNLECFSRVSILFLTQIFLNTNLKLEH